jgi:hypothetical protein
MHTNHKQSVNTQDSGAAVCLEAHLSARIHPQALLLGVTPPPTALQPQPAAGM